MSDEEFGPYDMAEMYRSDCELYLGYIYEDLTRSKETCNGCRLDLALSHLSVVKYNVEMLEYTIKKIQAEAAANAGLD